MYVELMVLVLLDEEYLIVLIREAEALLKSATLLCSFLLPCSFLLLCSFFRLETPWSLQSNTVNIISIIL